MCGMITQFTYIDICASNIITIPQRYSDTIILISSNSLRIFGHQVDEKNPLDSGDVAEADENGDDNMVKVKSYYYQKNRLKGIEK